MKKVSQNKKSKYRTINKKIYFFFLPVLSFIVLFTGSYIWYQSRAIPEINEETHMMTLPPEMLHVLGTSTTSQTNAQASIRVPILLYHYVEYVHNDPGKQNLNIPPNILTEQIETLKKDGYTFITPDDLISVLGKSDQLHQKVVILSFDDGYMDFYTDVFPILQKEQVKAVAYIVPNFLDRPNYLFTFQLKQIAKSPLVEIGAHTMDHLWLQDMSKEKAAYQIAQSKKQLQDLLHLPINSFAYPYGAFDSQAVQLVKDAGFTNAVSTLPGIMQSQDNEYYLFRLRPGYRTGTVLLSFLKQNTFQAF
jgi:peptidoglycan/xylan/chitin deacetylase (PgdA/CDA1 family)